MQLNDFTSELRARLIAAAATGGPEIQDAAERLALALEPAIHLGLLSALSDAAAEITAELTDGTTVEVRLVDRAPSFVVTPPPATVAEPIPGADEVTDAGAEADANLARISLRLPEAVKLRAEDKAARAGQSLNSWLVAAVRTATDAPTAQPGGRPSARSGKRIQGWVR